MKTGQKGQYVYVVKPDHSVDMRPVTVFTTVGQDSIIDRGLTPGETVVTDGQLRLTPKSKVDVKQGTSQLAAPGADERREASTHATTGRQS